MANRAAAPALGRERSTRRASIARGTVVVLSLVILRATAAAAEMEPRTSKAYDEYLERARRAFLARVTTEGPSPLSRTVTGRPGREDGIIGVPGGLVHHWVGAAFVSGASLPDALDVSQDYPDYSSIHESVIRSRLLSRQGDTFHTLMRLTEGGAGITAVLDVRSTVRYVRTSARSVYAISSSDEVREVENAGKDDERLKPAGRDSGYLWRADTFSRFVQRDGGVYVEMETLGLSRRFPPFLGWIIEPIARRIGRKSVEGSLHEFVAEIQLRTN